LGASPIAPVLPRAAGSPVTVGVAHMVSEKVMTADAKSKAAANLLRLGFIDFSFWFFGFSVYICVGLFLAAVQMCFCPIKRKSRLKPAMFFIARYKTAKNFRRRLLRISKVACIEAKASRLRRAHRAVRTERHQPRCRTYRGNDYAQLPRLS
jgi:hypothetical protein